MRVAIINRKHTKKRWKGFQKYLYKIIVSHIMLILIPICILGVFWFCMMSSQAEQKFHQQKTAEMNEIVSSIKQRIKTIKTEVAVETKEQKYSTYKFSDEYRSDLSMICSRLYTMTEKYHLLHSVYFYDETTGRIYNSKSGSYDINEFYDVKWLADTKNMYSVQMLPLRYAFDNEELLQKYSKVYSEYNKLVLSIVLKGKPDYYLIANISIEKLFTDIVGSYDLDNPAENEFFYIDTSGKLLEGKCEYIQPESLLGTAVQPIGNNVLYLKQNNRIYFMESLDCGIYSVMSYPAYEAYQESQYLGKYVILVCLGVLVFLLAISVYMAKRLYHPIDTLYSDIAENTKGLSQENVSNEIDMLKHVFSEMNAFNSNAKLKLMQFDEISKTIRFRNFLENAQRQQDFLQDHPYLFGESGDCLCEILLLKLDVPNMGMSTDDEVLFRLNLEEVLRTYLQSSLKGVLTKIEEDNMVLLYSGSEEEDLKQTRMVLTDTVFKLTEQNAFFAISQTVKNIEEVIPQYHCCLELIKNAYFFNWKNQIITADKVTKGRDIDDIYRMLLNINTAFIRSIVSQNPNEIENLVGQLESELRKINNSSQVKDVCSRIVVDLDNEFHFAKYTEANLLQALNDNKTLPGMIAFISNLLRQVNSQYGNNNAKEHNYCEAAKKYMDENYMRDMNITDVADYLNISYSYLSKIFRAKVELTLTDYFNNIRIEKSKEYLANTSLTLCEICEKIGYNNVQSYQRFFKKYVNITPGDYRKLHDNKTPL